MFYYDRLFPVPESTINCSLSSSSCSVLEAVLFNIDRALACSKSITRKCSSELLDLVPHKRVTVRGTCFSKQMHCHTVNFVQD